MSRSLVLYRGPSLYDPETTIRVTLTPRSRNRKTGKMFQMAILHDALPPQDAQRCGADHAVCGSCPYRPALRGGCYVNACRGPLMVWRATNGKPVATMGQILRALGHAPRIRLGSYGDPAAAPAYLIRWLVAISGRAHTGYTHGWRTRPDLAPYLMASTDTLAEEAEARAAGWRTFRPRAPDAPNLPGEITCPSETRGTECASCLLCNGAGRARSITIPVHGYATRKALAVVA